MRKEELGSKGGALARRKEGVARLELRERAGAPHGEAKAYVEPTEAGGSPRGRRWTLGRKTEAVLRLLRGESADQVSRAFAIDIGRLEDWRQRALRGMESGLKERGQDALAEELGAAKRQIGELAMQNELLRIRCDRAKVNFPYRRSRP